MGAISGEHGESQCDEYGNPIGGNFDLAKDGAFEGFRLLIGSFCSELQVADINSLAGVELEKKGWKVKVVQNMADFTHSLRTENLHVAWIISDQKMKGDATDFSKAVHDFHLAGRGLMIWGDNDPYFAHANKLLGDMFAFNLMGYTPGGQELLLGPYPSVAGRFGKHLVCSGIQRLNEGITICYPDHMPEGWSLVGTSSNGHPALLAKDAASVAVGAGRVVVDTGFTKLMKDYWTTAGTPRYVSNCCAWLALRERFKGPLRGFNLAPVG